jgi:hypothetical protein
MVKWVSELQKGGETAPNECPNIHGYPWGQRVIAGDAIATLSAISQAKSSALGDTGALSSKKRLF